MEQYVVRLFAFMPDRTLDQVILTRQMCYEVGWLAGKLDTALQVIISLLKMLSTIHCPINDLLHPKYDTF